MEKIVEFYTIKVTQQEEDIFLKRKDIEGKTNHRHWIPSKKILYSLGSLALS